MTNALTISGLTKSYNDFVLDHVSFTVPSGSIVGLIGENGAGKSTTINAALGLIQKESGQDSKLLILDEATSGLDPVIRDDILDMLLEFVQNEECSILVSSHITSDLEKLQIISSSFMREKWYFPSPRMN